MRAWLAVLAAAALAGCAAKPLAVPASVLADADYLLQLGLMRGHLLVGHALYASGEHAAAGTHAKHPSDELYAGVAEAFPARGATPFGEQLERHAQAVAAGASEEVDAAYAAVTAAIDAAEEVVDDATPALRARVIVLLLREAALEYGIGVVDERLENAHEYQDAYGFTQVALRLARAEHAHLAQAEAADREIFRRIAADIQALADMWPALMPPPRIPHPASRIDAAAADIEQLALRLSQPSRFR